MSPRETIYLTLYNTLLGVFATGTFKTSSRRLQHWSDVANADQPAFFLTQGIQDAAIQQKLPTLWTLHASVYLYAKTGGSMRDTPMQILNPFIDAIADVLLPPAAIGEQTLGGLVQRCRIDGAIETDEGVLGDQGVVIIPITMFLPQ